MEVVFDEPAKALLVEAAHVGDIDQAVAMLLKDSKVNVVTSVCRDTNFQLRPTPAGIEWVTHNRTHEETRRQDMPPMYRLNGGIYVYRTEEFLAEQWVFYGSIRMHVMPEERSIDIDTPHDLIAARAIAEHAKRAMGDAA